jgi:hypothetical protein
MKIQHVGLKHHQNGMDKILLFKMIYMVGGSVKRSLKSAMKEQYVFICTMFLIQESQIITKINF